MCNNSPFLSVRDVVKRYDGHVALNGVSLDVPEGCIYGLLGPNGAGKTSLIRILNRITRPDDGSVTFQGHALCDDDIRRIGYLPEERGLYKKMRVGEEIVYLERLKGMTRRDAEREMTVWLERFGLAEWRNKKVEALSKGMAQKVQFIATVLHRPPLLIFDEPFSGFDPVNAEQLKREILRLRDEGATILFSTHNMGSVEEICEQITLIDHAETVLQGGVMEVRRRFAKQIYRVAIAEPALSRMDDTAGMFEIVAERPSVAGRWEADIRIYSNVSVREVIAWLNERHTILCFQEILPTMQEIFIETVSPTTERPS